MKYREKRAKGSLVLPLQIIDLDVTPPLRGALTAVESLHSVTTAKAMGILPEIAHLMGFV